MLQTLKMLIAVAAAVAPVVTIIASTVAGMFVGAAAILTVLVLFFGQLRAWRGPVVAVALAVIGLFCAGGLVWAATDVLDGSTGHGAATSPPPPPPPPVPPRSPPSPPRGDTKPNTSPNNSGSSTPAGELPNAPSEPTECAANPGDDAPEFAAKTLRELYLGPALKNADPPPGLKVGGCPSPTYSSAGNEDSFAYVIGTDRNTTIKSVAVMSKRYGYAIFLAPAAQQVLTLINRYGDIGGWARTKTGRGDHYGVKTPVGTAILMRGTTVLDNGTGHAQGYVVLPPAAATLWLKAMRRHGAWLWALLGRSAHGKRRIRLVANLQTNKLMDTITVDPRKGRARVGGQRSWHAPGPDLNPDEIKLYADRAG